MKQKQFSKHFKISKTEKAQLIKDEKKAIHDYEKAGMHAQAEKERQDLRKVYKAKTK